MAGFAAKGIQDSNFFNIKNLYENRGVSFAMGGVSYAGFYLVPSFNLIQQDPNVVTVPNIMNYYSYNLVGSSVGDHVISICFGKLYSNSD